MSQERTLVSIVVPCYNEEEAIPIFYQTLQDICGGLPYEFEYVFVNDGSKDATFEKIQELHTLNPNVTGISFSRNFGKEASILAGFKQAKGEAIILMDADLQDPPTLVPKMLHHFEQGFERIYTRRRNRKGEPVIRSFFANRFYKVINRISDVELVDGMRDYCLLSRRVVEELLTLQETNRFSKGLFQWIGFEGVCLEFDHQNRVAGQTKWSFFKLCNYAIEGITAFSNAPLRYSAYVGLFVASMAFLYLGYIVFNTLIYGNPTPGWSSIVCVSLFLGGLQLIFLGVLGEYIGRIYNEVKNRPTYIVQDVLTSSKENE